MLTIKEMQKQIMDGCWQEAVKKWEMKPYKLTALNVMFDMVREYGVEPSKMDPKVHSGMEFGLKLGFLFGYTAGAMEYLNRIPKAEAKKQKSISFSQLEEMAVPVKV